MEGTKNVSLYMKIVLNWLCVCVVSADAVLNCLKYLLLMTDMHRKLELTST